MWLKETKPVCCIEHEPLPSDIKCLTPDICQEMKHLYRRHQRKFYENNERVMELAVMKPRQREARFLRKCPCFFKKAIEIIRLEQRERTRTEQLSYPIARKLLLFKEEARKLFPPERLFNLNRLIRKSLLSVYSRLGNVQPPLQRKPIPKWNKAEWSKHTRKLKKLAKPKVVKMPPKLPVKSKPLNEMKRFKNLAKPKKYVSMEQADWHLTPAMRKHIASERIKNLAKHIIRDTSMLYQELPIQIPLGVLKHKASQRIAKLAEPSARRTNQSASADLRENPFAVSPNALKTKASKRTTELAEPKEYENKHIREDPYAISKAVLNAKAKPRTIELAKPRKR